MAQEVKNMYWEDVEEKQDLPEQGRDIDATLIIAGAIWASHDFMPIHHDREFAQEKGAPNIFMNILTSNGILATFLEEWAGPEAEIKEMTASLVVPNFPGDHMVMNARVVRKWESAGEHLIELQYSGDNQMGPHINGTAIMSLPTKR